MSNEPEATVSAAEDLIEADNRLDFDDEGYSESLNTSYVTSIASDIRKGIEEVLIK